MNVALKRISKKSRRFYCDNSGFKGYVCGNDIKVGAGDFFDVDSAYGIRSNRRDL